MRLVVTGGGTGGHLFPGIAVATGMRQQVAGAEILFIGTSRQLDRDTLAGLDFQQASIRCAGLKGMGPVSRLRSLFLLPGAVIEALGVLKRFRPDLVFGVGGYVTGPVLLAAKIKKIPICIHEQNSVPGLANRLAGRLADRIFISIPCSPAFGADKVVQTGNPVREEIVEAAREKEEQPVHGSRTLLVLGGSQGAHRVNELVLTAVERLRQKGEHDFHIIHQTGRRDRAMVEAGYRALGVRAEVADFFNDMARLYREADLVVSRAGATTLAELSVMGLPALLIPFPHAADNHQETNAEFYVSGGGARLLRESLLNGNILAEEIASLMYNDADLLALGKNMKKLGQPGATGRIVDACLRLTSRNVQ